MGEERCIKYQTAVNPDTVCEKCPSNYFKHKLNDIPGSEVVVPWINHLVYLDGLVQCGCKFTVDDLTKAEWDGLLLIHIVRREIEKEQMEKADRERQLKSVTNTAVRHK